MYSRFPKPWFPYLYCPKIQLQDSQDCKSAILFFKLLWQNPTTWGHLHITSSMVLYIFFTVIWSTFEIIRCNIFEPSCLTELNGLYRTVLTFVLQLAWTYPSSINKLTWLGQFEPSFRRRHSRQTSLFRRHQAP